MTYKVGPGSSYRWGYGAPINGLINGYHLEEYQIAKAETLRLLLGVRDFFSKILGDFEMCCFMNLGSNSMQKNAI